MPAFPLVAKASATAVDLAASRALAVVLADCLQPGMKIYLSGDLGAGKTTLVRELLRRLGYTGRVASPTFTLMEPYNLSKFEIHHFDFYRLSEPEAWRDAGFEESFTGAAVVLVEWPEHAGGALPTPDLSISLSVSAKGAELPQPARPDNASEDAAGAAQTEATELPRYAQFEAFSHRGAACLNALLVAGCCAREP